MSEQFIFELAQYAQQELLAEFNANKDLLRFASVEALLHSGGDHRVQICAFYDHDTDQSLHEALGSLAPKHDKLRNMPLMVTVRSREAVIDAMHQLAMNLSVVRVLLAKHSAALDAAEDGDSND